MVPLTFFSKNGCVHFIAMSFYFYLPNFLHIGACWMLKLQWVSKWDIFWHNAYNQKSHTSIASGSPTCITVFTHYHIITFLVLRHFSHILYVSFWCCR